MELPEIYPLIILFYCNGEVLEIYFSAQPFQHHFKDAGYIWNVTRPLYPTKAVICCSAIENYEKGDHFTGEKYRCYCFSR